MVSNFYERWYPISMSGVGSYMRMRSRFQRLCKDSIAVLLSTCLSEFYLRIHRSSDYAFLIDPVLCIGWLSLNLFIGFGSIVCGFPPFHWENDAAFIVVFPALDWRPRMVQRLAILSGKSVYPGRQGIESARSGYSTWFDHLTLRIYRLCDWDHRFFESCYVTWEDFDVFGSCLYDPRLCV